jgi:RimJ/RimL family protein N-acetyltransferase
MDIPILTTRQLVLRGLCAADWDAYAALSADSRVRDWLGGKLLSREESWTQMALFLGQWALRGYGIFAVECGGRLAGRVGLLHLMGWQEPELAWTLAPDFWGQGLATEAAATVRDWAFASFGFGRLVSYILPSNARSRRVAEKLGAARTETILRAGMPHDVWEHPAPGRGVVV